MAGVNPIPSPPLGLYQSNLCVMCALIVCVLLASAPDISVHVHMFSMIPFVSFHTPLVKDIVKSCQARLQCPQDSVDPACPAGMVQEVCGNAGWGNRGCGNSTQNWCGFSVGMMDSGGGRTYPPTSTPVFDDRSTLISTLDWIDGTDWSTAAHTGFRIVPQQCRSENF